MVLVHTFTLLAMQHNVQVHIQHIAGVSNDVTYALSHFKMDRFQQLCSHAESRPPSPGQDLVAPRAQCPLLLQCYPCWLVPLHPFTVPS